MSEFNAYQISKSDPGSLTHHDHDCHELVLIQKGASIFTIENRVYTAKAHSLVVIGNLERHHIQIDQTPYHRQVMLIPNSFLLEELHHPLLASFFLYRPQRFSHVLSLDDELFHLLYQHFCVIIKEFETNEPLKVHRLGILLQMMLIDLYRAKPEYFVEQNVQDMTMIYHVQRYVAQHFSECLTLTEMANHFHVSYYHLSRRFQEITGYGFQQYLTICRLNEAKRLLLMTDIPITLVAEDSGWGNVNHFIRTFRLREGTTPLQFRKNNAD